MAHIDEDRDDGQESFSNRYISKKDVKLFFIGVPILALLLTPVYRKLRDDSWETTTKNSMLRVFQAISLYATANDDKFPPAYYRGQTGPELEKGYPYVWLSLVKGGIPARTLLVSQAAVKEEYSAIGYGGAVPTTFGYYVAAEFRQVDDFDNDDTVLFAETTEGGALDTYDPMQMKPTDGWLIGYDTGNDRNRRIIDAASFVTRLAFKGSATAVKTGKWDDVKTRHPKSTFAVTVNGTRIKLTPEMMKIRRDSNQEILPPWSVPLRAYEAGR